MNPAFIVWSSPFRCWVFVVVTITVLTGCALPVPLSEGVMFEDAGQYGNDTRRVGPVAVAEGGTSLAVSVFAPVYHQLVRERYGRGFNTLISPLWWYGGGFPGFSFAIVDRAAIAVTPGIILVGTSVDGTVRLARQSYVTFSTNTFGSWEAILQYRILYANRQGLSVGGYYRQETHQTAESPTFDVRSYGGRLAFQLAAPRVRLRGFASIGTMPDYGIWVFRTGILIALPSPVRKPGW